MSKVDLYTCDRCQMKAEGVGTPQFPAGWVKLVMEAPWGHNDVFRFDCCEECQHDFTRWLARSAGANDEIA